MSLNHLGSGMGVQKHNQTGLVDFNYTAPVSPRLGGANQDSKKAIAEKLENIITDCTMEEIRGIDHLKALNHNLRAQRIYDQEFDRV